jgi:hypothetical protein
MAKIGDASLEERGVMAEINFLMALIAHNQGPP